MSQIRNKARKFAAMIGLCSVAFVAVPFSGTSVSAETAPAFTLSAVVENIALCSSVIGYDIRTTGGAVAKYSISPAVTKGLIFSSTTGKLSGKPEVVRHRRHLPGGEGEAGGHHVVTDGHGQPVDEMCSEQHSLRLPGEQQGQHILYQLGGPPVA